MSREALGSRMGSGLLAKPRSGGGEEFDQCVAIPVFGFRVAETVDAQRQVLDSAPSVKTHLKQDAFDVRIRLRHAKLFGAKLMVLPVPSLLRLLVSEVGTDIEHLDPRALVVEQPRLDDRAN